MRSATLQFLVAGALLVDWIWMLGRPLLTTLLRRSRRDSVGHFRSQQAALGRAGTGEVNRWTGLPGPVFAPASRWRAQPLERRRLQTMLAAAIATFASLLLAIALKGAFVRLFLLMTTCFMLYLVVAAYIGSRELKAVEAQRRYRRDVANERAEVRVDAETPATGAEYGEAAAPVEDPFDGSVFGSGLFDEGFFEPIPELGATAERTAGEEGDRSIFSRPILDEGDRAEETVEEVTEAPTETAASTSDDEEAPVEPTFTTPVPRRNRPPKRPKARPIYIESKADEGDGTIRAVND